MLAEMQSAMNNMVNNQLQSEFQLASITSTTSTPSSSSSSSSSSSCSPCPGLTVAAKQQPPAATLPSPSTQSPPMTHDALPPKCPSPGVDGTISAIARAHRETFVYGHDKLGPQNASELDNWGGNRCKASYHLNGHNTIYNHDNNTARQQNGYEALPDNSCYLPTASSAADQQQHLALPHLNNSHRVHNSNLMGSHQGPQLTSAPQGQNCPWKNRKSILLVSLQNNFCLMTF